MWAALRVLSQLQPPSSEGLLPVIRTYMEKMVMAVAQNEPRDKEERLSFLLGLPGVWLTAVYFYQVELGLYSII